MEDFMSFLREAEKYVKVDGHAISCTTRKRLNYKESI